MRPYPCTENFLQSPETVPGLFNLGPETSRDFNPKVPGRLVSCPGLGGAIRGIDIIGCVLNLNLWDGNMLL